MVNKKDIETENKIENNVVLYGTGNTSENALSVISEFQANLKRIKELSDDPSKKISETNKKAILEMKDKQIGSLRGQFMFISRQKKTEFYLLYKDEIEKLKKERRDLKDSITLEIREVTKKKIDKLKEFIVKFSKELYSDIEKFDKHKKIVIELNHLNLNVDFNKIDYDNLIDEDSNYFRNLKNNIIPNLDYNLKEIPYDKILEMIYSLHYEKSFNNVKNKLDVLEKQFVEALNWNMLISTMNTYQELKKADYLLSQISKIKIEKIDIDFTSYLDDKNYQELVRDYENSKIIILNPTLKDD